MHETIVYTFDAVRLGREPINGLYPDQRNDVRSRAQSGLYSRPLPCHLCAKDGHSAVSMTFSIWKGRGVCAAGAAHVRMTGKFVIWKTQALCATVASN